jgi:transposase-like protein
MMAERGVDVSHTTILRWVQCYVPEFERRWRRYARPVGTSWRVDETYIRVRGRWTYLYRAVERHGLTIDFLPGERRDTAAARRFLTRAVERHGALGRMTLDGYPATHAAVAELKASGVIRPETKVWTSKYLNNLVEQDHRRVKQRVYPLLGFKRFRNATIAITGIEPAQKIRKGQFDMSGVIVREEARVPHVWEAVLAA